MAWIAPAWATETQPQKVFYHQLSGLFILYTQDGNTLKWKSEPITPSHPLYAQTVADYQKTQTQNNSSPSEEAVDASSSTDTPTSSSWIDTGVEWLQSKKDSAANWGQQKLHQLALPFQEAKKIEPGLYSGEKQLFTVTEDQSILVEDPTGQKPAKIISAFDEDYSKIKGNIGADQVIARLSSRSSETQNNTIASEPSHLETVGEGVQAGVIRGVPVVITDKELIVYQIDSETNSLQVLTPPSATGTAAGNGTVVQAGSPPASAGVAGGTVVNNYFGNTDGATAPPARITGLTGNPSAASTGPGASVTGAIGSANSETPLAALPSLQLADLYAELPQSQNDSEVQKDDLLNGPLTHAHRMAREIQSDGQYFQEVAQDLKQHHDNQQKIGKKIDQLSTQSQAFTQAQQSLTNLKNQSPHNDGAIAEAQKQVDALKASGPIYNQASLGVARLKLVQDQQQTSQSIQGTATNLGIVTPDTPLSDDLALQRIQTVAQDVEQQGIQIEEFLETAALNDLDSELEKAGLTKESVFAKTAQVYNDEDITPNTVANYVQEEAQGLHTQNQEEWNKIEARVQDDVDNLFTGDEPAAERVQFTKDQTAKYAYEAGLAIRENKDNEVTGQESIVTGKMLLQKELADSQSQELAAREGPEVRNQNYDEMKYSDKGEEGCEYSTSIGVDGVASCEGTKGLIQAQQLTDQVTNGLGQAALQFGGMQQSYKAASDGGVAASLKASAAQTGLAGDISAVKAIKTGAFWVMIERRRQKHSNSKKQFEKTEAFKGLETQVQEGLDARDRNWLSSQAYLYRGRGSGSGKNKADSGWVSFTGSKKQAEIANAFAETYKMNEKEFNRIQSFNLAGCTTEACRQQELLKADDRRKGLMGKMNDMEQNVKDYSKSAAMEQKKMAKKAANQEILTAFTMMSELATAAFSYQAESDLKKAAAKLEQDSFQPSFDFDPLTSNPDAPTAGTTISGLTQGVGASDGLTIEDGGGIDLAGDSDLGDEIPEFGGEGQLEPALPPAQFTPGDAPQGSNSGPASVAGASTGEAFDSTASQDPRPAGQSANPGYAAGGAGYIGGARGGNSGGDGIGMGDGLLGQLLGKFLPGGANKEGDDTARDKAVGRSVASGNGISNRRSNLFKQVHFRYQTKTRNNEVGT